MGTFSPFSKNTTTTNNSNNLPPLDQQTQQAQTTNSQNSASLSPQAQAEMLYNQGETVSTIAMLLGTSTTTIQQYLSSARSQNHSTGGSGTNQNPTNNSQA